MRSPAASTSRAPVVVVAEQARVGVAERDDDRAGQRREVDEPLGAEVDRVREAVGEHEPALGVGVDDLDRRAGLGAHDVAGLDRVAATACSRSRRSRSRRAPAARAGRSRRWPRARRRRPTCRTSSRSSSRAGLIEMPPESNVTRLADEAEQRAGDVGRLVADRDQPRLLVASRARRAANAPMPAASISSRPQHLDAARRRAPARARPALVGVSVVGGRVLEVAGGVDRLGDDRGALDVGARRRGARRGSAPRAAGRRRRSLLYAPYA